MINPSFLGTIFLVSDYGLILLMPGEVKDELIETIARKEALRHEFQAQGATSIQFSEKPVHLGGETNVIYAEFDIGPRRACAISAVRGGFLVEVRFDGNLKDPNGKEAVQHLMTTFEFTTPTKPLRFAPIGEVELPSPLHDVLTAGSPKEARAALKRYGSPPIIRRPGYTMHRLGSEPDTASSGRESQRPTKRKSRKWWQFWK
jgi:hypothetical protein